MLVSTDENIQENLPRIADALERIATAMEEQSRIAQKMVQPEEQGSSMTNPLTAFYNAC